MECFSSPHPRAMLQMDTYKHISSGTSRSAYILDASPQTVREPVSPCQDIVYTPIQISDDPITRACRRRNYSPAELASVYVLCTNTYLLTSNCLLRSDSALSTFQYTDIISYLTAIIIAVSSFLHAFKSVAPRLPEVFCGRGRWGSYSSYYSPYPTSLSLGSSAFF